MKFKFLLSILVTLMISTTNAKTHSPMSQDEAKIRSAIYSFSALADQNAFAHLGRLFAPTITLDYRAIFGGEPSVATPQSLMQQWAGFLPGFDTTYHELSNINVVIKDDSAMVGVDFIARHWHGDNGFWAVSGRYHFALEKVADNWLINSLTVNNVSESGSRDVLGVVGKDAIANLKARDKRLVVVE